MTLSAPVVSPVVRADAAAAAASSAARAGVGISILDSVDELSAATDLLNLTWPAEVSVSILLALRKVGNYVGGAYRDGVLVGACVAFFGSSGSELLHSHLAAVSPAVRGSGVGWALKLAQRAWALDRGVTRIQWTYDPLEARNAFVNLTKLAARPIEYLDDFYGEYGDGPGVAFPTDRLLVVWDLADPRVAEAARGAGRAADLSALSLPTATLLTRDDRGAPREGSDHGEPTVVIEAPEDAAGLRAHDPALALEWRLRLRHHLGEAIRSGAETVGFTRDGRYVFRRAGA
jgi:predicted GNAT superfamily acetyltransferase